jgi:hypothetical protein
MPKQETARAGHEYTTSFPSASIDAPHALTGYQSDDELAEELDRSPRTLARWRAARTGPPYVVIGRRIFYRRAAVAEWLLKRERGFEENGGSGARRRGA